MQPPSIDSASFFESARQKIRENVDRGELESALVLCDEAVERARERGDREILDQMLCNRGGILIALGQGQRAVGELRRILLGSASPANRFQAAYDISQHHERKGETERSLFYARLALDHARKSGVAEFEAGAHNRLANLQMLDSAFDDACSSYRRALGLRTVPCLERALALSNLGYCQAVQGRLGDGFGKLFASLRMMRRLDARRWTRFPHLGLSYAYLEIERPERALRHASAALALSETAAASEQIKSSLYLLGESQKLCGDEEAAYQAFERLQDEFYPEEHFIIDLLMSTDIRKLINVMA